MALLEELPSLEDLLSHQGLERKDLGGRYPADMRLEIIQLFDDWKMRGYYFGFTSQKLNDIKIDNDNEEQRRIALLNAWEQRKGKGPPSYLKLVEVLHHRGRADLVERVCGMFRRMREKMGVLDKSTPAAGIRSCKMYNII